MNLTKKYRVKLLVVYTTVKLHAVLLYWEGSHILPAREHWSRNFLALVPCGLPQLRSEDLSRVLFNLNMMCSRKLSPLNTTCNYFLFLWRYTEDFGEFISNYVYKTYTSFTY